MKLDCGHPPSKHGKHDRKQMAETGKIVLFLTISEYMNMRLFQDGKLTNWPGSLEIPCRVKRGRHNMAGTRYDVWFRLHGKEWHGVQYGDNTQICHCKRLKH